jgi:predicted PurR-regulated permease PerM
VTSAAYARITAIATATLAAVAVLAMLYAGRTIFVPIALAVLLAAVLRPVVRWLQARRVPAPAAAALLVLGSLALVAVGGAALAGPVRAWAAKAPAAAESAGRKLQSLRRRFDRFGAMLSPALAPESAAPGSAAPPPAERGEAPAPSTPKLESVAVRVFGTTTEVVSGVTEMLLVLFFLLAAGDLWRHRIVEVAHSPEKGRRSLEIVHEMQHVISRYMVATLLINIGQGLLVGIAMALVGMPGPILWGLLTIVAEFIPFLGGLVMVVLLALVGLATSDSVGHALLAPALYLLITTLQNNLVSPVVYGRGLRLSPLAVLLAVVMWGYLWGVAGAFLAVPILAGVKVVCDRVEGWKAVGVLLEG